jgi:hypothetical protein
METERMIAASHYATVSVFFSPPESFEKEILSGFYAGRRA